MCLICLVYTVAPSFPKSGSQIGLYGMILQKASVYAVCIQLILFSYAKYMFVYNNTPIDGACFDEDRHAIYLNQVGLKKWDSRSDSYASGALRRIGYDDTACSAGL